MMHNPKADEDDLEREVADQRDDFQRRAVKAERRLREIRWALRLLASYANEDDV